MEQVHEDLGLVDVRDRLHCDRVRTGRGQQLEARPVEVTQPRGGDAVAPAVLRTVGEDRPVGPDRRRHPAIDPIDRQLVPHFAGHLDTANEQRRRFAGHIPWSTNPGTLAW